MTSDSTRTVGVTFASGAEALALVRRCYRTGLTETQMKLVALSVLEPPRLWPYLSNDAAILLRAGQLVGGDGLGGRDAIARTRAELGESRQAVPHLVRIGHVDRTGHGLHGDPYRHHHGGPSA